MGGSVLYIFSGFLLPLWEQLNTGDIPDTGKPQLH